MSSVPTKQAFHSFPSWPTPTIVDPQQIWEDLSLDLIEVLQKSDGYDTILVVVDRLGKYAHFLGLMHPFTVVAIAVVFTKEVMCLHGVPRTIVSNRDKIFFSKYWGELFRLQGTTLRFNTAYHLQSDGQTEVPNKCLEAY